jgi:ribosomal peptide maturation radical SAM protein 1
MDELAYSIVAMDPKMVGFSIAFAQSIASIELARRIKRLDPAIKVVFGGPALIDGVGDVLLRNYPCIDAVYYGDAEGSLPDFVRGVIPKCVSTRERKATTMCRVDANAFAFPDYLEFFSEMARLQVPEVKNTMKFPFETGRGCWWGFKHACVFCSEDVTLAPYRAKPWQKIVNEVVVQAHNHQVFSFFAVDSVLDYKDHRELLRALASTGLDLEFFFAVKSNIGLEDIKLLKQARAYLVQPGIESLSTPILRLMSKGVSAIQNVRFLKMSKWLGLQLTWTFLVGFLGEDPSEYEKMTALARNLRHLFPPQDVVPCLLYRGSKLFRNPAAHGIEIVGPLPIYEHLYDLPFEEIRALAFKFQYVYASDNRNYREYTAELKQVSLAWRRNYFASTRVLLRYYNLGPNIIVLDERDGDVKRYELDEVESHIYRSGFDIAVVSRLVGDNPDIEKVFVALEARGLIFRENDLFISLAIPVENP